MLLRQDFTTIDWTLGYKHIRSDTLWQTTYNWLIICGIGVLGGISAAWIDVAGEFAADLKRGLCVDVWYLNQKFCCWYKDGVCDAYKTLGYFQFIQFICVSVVLAFISARLVQFYAPYASGSGIPEVKTILGGFVMKGFLGVWTLIIKIFGLVLSVGSGLTLGKEGPLVHVCACIGNILCRKLTDEVAKREILSASAAAGVAVAFGSPIGGVLFALEEVSTYFTYKTMWRSFVCAMVATATLQLLNPFRTNQIVLFQVVYDRDWHDFELIWFIVLGCLGGLWGAAFIKFNLLAVKLRKKHLKDFPVVEVVCIAFVTAVIGYTNFYSRADMSELVSKLFTECEHDDFGGLCNVDDQARVIFSLLFVALMKMALVCVTFGSQIPAGIFIPSMTIGACVGRVIGMLMKTVQQAHPDWGIFASCKLGSSCVTPGTYALVGAAASLAGVTRMTVSLVVITFELTGALTYVIPIMIAVMTAKWIGDLFGKAGIYEQLIELKEYPFLDHKIDYIDTSFVHEVMIPAERTVSIQAHGETFQSLGQILEDETFQGYPVVNKHLLVGFITYVDLVQNMEIASKLPNVTRTTLCRFGKLSGKNPEQMDSQLLQLQESPSLPMQNVQSDFVFSFEDLVDTTPFTLPANASMDLALEFFKKLGLRYLLVTENGRLMGILTKKDLLEHLKSIGQFGRDPFVLPRFNPHDETSTVASTEVLFSNT